tara:strand:+ start:750 stop:1265 length:516 start_codon:yes stop_codon:yes gene_type:complete
MHSLCANFLILCSLVNFDFTYKTQEEFVTGIRNCTLQANAFMEPYERVPVNLSIAQATLESGYGMSRFAIEGKNYYGIRETDKTEPHIKSLDPNAHNDMLRRYEHNCASTFDYIELLTTDDRYEEFQYLLLQQWAQDEYDLYALANALSEPYAKDKTYAEKLHKMLDKLND